MKAEEILLSSWRQIFAGAHSPEEIKSGWKLLAKQWHPDTCKDPRAREVFDHITTARDRALNGGALFTEFRQADGRLFKFSYLSRRRWEAGEIFVTESAVVYRIDIGFADLAERAYNRKFTYHDAKMKVEMERLLPNLVRSVQLDTEGRLLIYRRNKDQILLSDLLASENMPMPDVHVMWMVSSLLNICSYFYVSNLTHFGITPEMLLICPEKHSIALTGPCLYMREFPDRPTAVPAAILSLWPALKDKSAKTPHFKVDTRQIRIIAKQALGVPDYVTLKHRTDLHPGLVQFLLSQPHKDSVEDYRLWTEMRGQRKFIPYDLKPQQVYDLG